MANNDFAKQVIDSIKDYTDDVVDALNKEVIKLGEEGANELKNLIQPPASESGTANPMTRRSWKNYAKDWTCKVVEGTNYISATIHNKRHYQLTHLLEYGHATKDGKRTRAFKHIAPIEEDVVKKLEKNTKEIIKRGGK